MKAIQFLTPRISKVIQKFPEVILILGIVLMAMAHLRYSVAVTAWVAMVPFLYYLRLPSVRFKVLKFGFALFVAWSLIVFKIITDPIPVLMVFMYAVPISLIHLPGYLLWMKGRKVLGGAFLFPVVMVVMEWVQYSYTPLGSWGSLAYTQTGQLAILQGLSLFGLAGLSFIVYSVNVLVAGWLMRDNALIKRYRWVLALVLVLLVYGEIRLDHYAGTHRDMVKVAAIGTDSQAGGLPLPSNEKNTGDFSRILKRTRTAATAGSQLAVWTEAAFITEPSYEKRWIDSMRNVADRYDIVLVASYVNVISTDPFRYENKFHVINSDGEIERTYHKHEPVPGEPAVKGSEPFAISNLSGAKLGGAICYDYDFPYIARGFGKVGADIVALPSSDWQGIDPLHTEMAAFRAIEQGHAVLRSTRFGLSAAIDPVGKMIAQRSSFDQHDGILIADLPQSGINTVYATVGDVVIYLGLVYLLLLGTWNITSSRKTD